MALTRKQIGQRLREVREAIGYTQADVADRLGLHRPTVSEIEAGRRAVTSEELYRFAELYATSVSALLSDPPPSVEAATAVLFRGEGVDSPDTHRAIKLFIERCEAERELELLLGLPPRSDTRPAYRVPAPNSVGDAVRQGERIAEGERRRLGIGTEPIRSPLDVLEKQGVRIGPLQAPPGAQLDGFYLETEELGACVAVKYSRPDDWTGLRAAFTAAHEYAHWLLRDIQVEVFEFKPGTDNLLEVRANSFAAAFLLPEAGVRDYLTANGLLEGDRMTHISPADVVRMMTFFGVSRQALLYRIQNLRLVGTKFPEELWAFPVQATADALGITFGLRQYMSLTLPALAMHAWRKGLISTGRAAELCDLDIVAFQKVVRDIGEEPEEGDNVPLVGAAAGE